MAAPNSYTVRMGMAECGVNDIDLFNDQTAAERLAEDLFGGSFETCLDKTHEELDANFKTYSELTQVQGQIRLLPGVKRNIKAFIQWVQDEFRLGRNPRSGTFNSDDTPSLIRRYKTHKQFIDKSSDLSDACKPAKFGSNTKWKDWAPSFINYLRTIPGRDGVPLKYICRETDIPDPTPNNDFLDDYVMMAPIGTGEAYTIDAAEVHTLIVKFIAGNETAEIKIKPHENDRDGRKDWKALKEHYKGIGIHAFDIIEAESTLTNLFYSGEKYPHMYWEKFEKQLTNAFTTYAKVEGYVVHSTAMKLRILLSKVKADFLVHVKSGINIELTKVPLTMTYEQALATFCNEVNLKHPPQMSATTTSRERRYVRKISTGQGRGWRDGRGRSGQGHGGRGCGNWVTKTRTDSSIITLTDGQKIEYHPSFMFPNHIFNKMKQQDKDRLSRERSEHKKRKANEITTLTAPMPLVHTSKSMAEISQVTQSSEKPNARDNNPGSTMMGGRNERANTRRE